MSADRPSSAPDERPRERRQRVQAAETGMAVLKGLADLGGRASLTALSAHVQESTAKEPITKLRDAVRKAGCASVRDTNLRGISAVSAPLHDHTGRVCAVLTALGATGGFDATVDGPIATAVRHEAAAISSVLGYSDSPSRP